MSAKTQSAQVRDDRATLEFIQQLRGLVAFHQAIGVEGYPVSQALTRFVLSDMPETKAPEIKPPSRPALKRSTEAKPVLSPVPGGLSAEIHECLGCHLGQKEAGDLLEGGINNVELLLVTDKFNEDIVSTDRPFHGESEKLLERMLAAIDLGLRDVHPVSLLRCARAQGQCQESQEACLTRLRGEIALYRPRIICIMGQTASQILLGTKLPLHRLRGRIQDLEGIPVIVTYPPDFLLKNPEMKKAAWQDLQLIQKKLRAGK